MNLSIKNVPEDLVNRLRGRAKANHRSLQGELMALLEQTVTPQRVSVQEARRRLADFRYQTGDEATQIVRDDRDGR